MAMVSIAMVTGCSQGVAMVSMAVVSACTKEQPCPRPQAIGSAPAPSTSYQPESANSARLTAESTYQVHSKGEGVMEGSWGEGRMGMYCGERALSLGEAEPVMYSSLNHRISQWQPAVPATPPSSSCAPGRTQACSLDAWVAAWTRRVAAWTRRVAACTMHRVAGHAAILQPHVLMRTLQSRAAEVRARGSEHVRRAYRQGLSAARGGHGRDGAWQRGGHVRARGGNAPPRGRGGNERAVAASDAREVIEEWRGEDEGVGQLMHRHPHQVVRAPSVRGLGQVLG